MARGLSGSGRIIACVFAAASLAACASVTPRANMGPMQPQKVGAPYQVGGIWYVPREQPNYDEVGVASWYGDQFHLKATADGEIFDMNAVSGAHTTLPLPCIVEVTNLDNGRKLRVRVNDRGPFVGGRIIDLSHQAARELGYDRVGLAHVRVRYVGPAPMLGPEAGVREAVARPAPSPAPRVLQAAATVRWTPEPEAPAGPPIVLTAASAPTSEVIQSPPELPDAPIAAPIYSSPVRAAATPTAGKPAAQANLPRVYRIQAGAFAEEARARRVAARLSPIGEAVIEPIQRRGVTLYRVLLPAPSDELQAFGLREKVAEIGFVDARVVRSF